VVQGAWQLWVTDIDPITIEEFLEILICDECVRQKSVVGKVTHVNHIYRVETADAKRFESQTGENDV